MVKIMVLVYLSAALAAGTVAIQAGSAMTGLMAQAGHMLMLRR